MKGKQNGVLDNRLMRQARSCGAQIRSRSWMLYLEIPLVGALSGARPCLSPNTLRFIELFNR